MVPLEQGGTAYLHTLRISTMSRVQPAILLLFPLAFGAIVSAMPSPVSGAPVPKPERKITVEQLRALLGKSHLSKEIQVFRKSIGEKPVASYSVSGAETDTIDIETHFFHSFHKNGVSMLFDEKGELAYMHLYIQAGDGFMKYTGQLPGGIEPTDKPADVRKKLGDPSEIEDTSSPTGGGWWTYGKKGLVINYSTSKTDDPKAMITTIAISPIAK